MARWEESRRALAVSAAICLGSASVATGAAGCGGDDAPAPPATGDDGSIDGVDAGPDSRPDGGPAVEADPWEPPPPAPPLGAGAIADARRDMLASLATVPYTHGALAIDSTTGETILESGADRALTPASNTKLFTTGAALELLGEDHRFLIRAYGTAPIGSDGTLDGDLVLVAEHDFTLSSDLFAAPRFPLDHLVRLLRRTGLRRVTGAVELRGEILFEGYEYGYLDVASERATAAARLGDALAAASVAVGSVRNAAGFDPPAGRAMIAEEESPPLFVACSPLMTHSNNELADMLARHVGWSTEGASSYAAGARAVLDWLRSFGAPTAGIALNDGSGLSHDNKVTARAVVAMLEFMRTVPAGPLWEGGFAIGGVRGTLGSRLTSDDTRGRVFAKTGTLSDTVALSGYLHNRYDGQVYVFSFLLNAVVSETAGRAAMDGAVEVLARDHRGLGARPAAPRLRLVRATGTAGVLEIAWDAVDGADGYLVFIGEDGRTFARESARYVHATTFRAGELPESAPVFVRVTAVGATGESDPSATYAAVAASASGDRDILLVDANDRWRQGPQPENHLHANHAFLAELGIATGDRTFDSASNEAVRTGDVLLDGYRAVVWAAGEESTEQESISDEEQPLLRAYVEAGGALVVSGSEVGWDLDAQGTDTDRAFIHDVLHASLESDDANSYELEGATTTPLEAIALTSFFTPDAMVADYPDVLAPVGDGAAIVVEYASGSVGRGAAIGHAGTSRTVLTGFPIESIASDRDRRALLDAIWSFLGI